MLPPSDAPVSELSLELLLLQVVLPALLEQGHTRTWLKNIIRAWCQGAAWCLDLHSYLLGDIPQDNHVSLENTGKFYDLLDINDLIHVWCGVDRLMYM